MTEKRDRISDEHMQRYLRITGEALEKAVITAPERSHLRKVAGDFMLMARTYYEDGQHFYGKGDLVNAFGCVNYAHGWLDAGARLGLFDVGLDDRLFTLAG